MRLKKIYDIVIIGGGFYGSILACYLKKKGRSVLLLEAEKEILLKASYSNQARIHNGYHYPRSFLTAYRSHLNYLRFIKDFKVAVFDQFKQYYAIAATLSKTTGQQFYKFARQLGSFVKPAPEEIRKLFNPNTIDQVFEVEEIVFDAGILRQVLTQRLTKLGIEVVLKAKVQKVIQTEKELVSLKLNRGRVVLGKCVFNCTYSGINQILKSSRLPLISFKQEFIEMPLIKVPPELEKLAISVFDGPFFGFLPFPDKDCHSIWHVRYSIRANWLEPIEKEVRKKLKKITQKSNWNFMKKDAQRFIPLFKEAKYLDSIYEIKTVLPKAEDSDARPILFRKDHGIKNFHVVMGGKIDNIYDIIEKIKEEKLV